MSSNAIPGKSRQIVGVRSLGRCERCGGRGSEWHHRRSRSVRDEHRHCVCNGVLLCGQCHRWAHGHPAIARQEGFIVARHGIPAEEPFLHWNGLTVQPNCEGTLSQCEMEKGSRR